MLDIVFRRAPVPLSSVAPIMLSDELLGTPLDDLFRTTTDSDLHPVLHATKPPRIRYASGPRAIGILESAVMPHWERHVVLSVEGSRHPSDRGSRDNLLNENYSSAPSFSGFSPYVEAQITSSKLR